MSAPRIGLALSGGGFRATAFGLGCLRALHDRDLLRHVTVVSGISGGSLLTAMWAYGPSDFESFDASVVDLLRRGLHVELARRALAPRAMAGSVVSAAKSALTRAPRKATRTDALVAALAARPFGARTMDQITHAGLRSVISATDIASGNAVRFGSTVSSCSAYGTIDGPVRVADAVAASAAYPVLLPALARTYEFRRPDGVTRRQLLMTDGGVYDNLGVSPLLPGRERAYSAHVYDLDYLVVADAGRGRANRRPARFLLGRLPQTFDVTYTKAQDAGRTRVHQAVLTGALTGSVHAYLGMPDGRLPIPIADLVPRERVHRYPTNFAPMSRGDLNAISIRGEQLTRALLTTYCPSL
ncbi:patatin-like phospholipase family protein [Cellulomonas sp. HZM]|uniref:patatin-like phospholipase family protein n=1 Tax=Cellulomonas sp. HZM TaxID=1454010 RepID=UPI0009DEBDD3|nr:patatin-like phospholipase family protein [Cellulomonas sp. HZM]